PLLMLANRDRLCGLQEPARAVGELFEIHSLPLFLGVDMVWQFSNTRSTRSSSGGRMSIGL
ncbi:MAG TPA: hypothetical protein VNS11_04455, partial [Sphingomicrobium sp.]|nr:hypothetical protein [Sphingomicrobium sp.]